MRKRNSPPETRFFSRLAHRPIYRHSSPARGVMDLAPSPRGDEGLSPSASGVSPSSARQKSLVDRLEQMMVFSTKELRFSTACFGDGTPEKKNPAPPMLRSAGAEAGPETDANAAKRLAMMRKIPVSMWTVRTTVGGFAASEFSKPEDRVGPLDAGIEEFRENPHKWIMVEYDTDQLLEPYPRPPNDQFYRLWPRAGMEGLEMQLDETTNNMVLWNTYQHLPSVIDFRDVDDEREEWHSYQGKKLHSKQYLPISPGRGHGVLDYRTDLKIIASVDPCDIHQGQVGDCWLLSAISALAEFPGAIHALFRHTEGLSEMPRATPNQYTVTLYDMATWQPVDVVIDERLAANPKQPGELLGARPSEDGELWVAYLEKALVVHCGGWDHIDGGLCYHAWAMLTGCQEQYMFSTDNGGETFACLRPFDPVSNELERHHNSSIKQHKVAMYGNPWPDVGGGGDAGHECDKDEFFAKLCAWENANFIVAAGTYGESDGDANNGLVDCHAYAVLRSVANVAGSGVDLVQVRNPWGNGEMEKGEWNDNGPGWIEYPAVKGYLDPEFKDDGLFWMSKEEVSISHLPHSAG